MALPPPSSNQASKAPDLVGTVRSIKFHNTDNGFCVFQAVVKDHAGLATIVGKALSIAEGETFTATGRWKEDAQFGKQFRTDSLNLKAPKSEKGIQRYLSSGLIDGIGEEYAKRLITAFGDKVFDVMDNEPDRLLKVPGIGKKKLERIMNSWSTKRDMRESLVFLQSHNIGPQRAATIFREYKAGTVEKIRDNPYCLYHDIRGIGFKTADSLATSIGLPKDSLVRARAGINHVMEEAIRNGHSACEYSHFISQCSEILKISDEIIKQSIEDAFAHQQFIKETVRGQTWLYTNAMFYGELGVSQLLKRLAKGHSAIPAIDAKKAIAWVQEKNQLQLAEAQQLAIEKALTSKVFVITGGPGVGKTTLVNSIVKILKAKKLNIALAAPTGRAAKRMQESAGMEAKTIHRLLEFDPNNSVFQKDISSPLGHDVYVIDEASMIDATLMFFLLKAIPEHAALILVGDVDQLPSVGAGKILEDIINSNVFPVIKLTQVYRQAAQSHIITNAHRINQGQLPEFTNADGSDFFFIEAASPAQVTDTIIRLVKERIPHKFKLRPLQDIQVLTPMNHSAIGTISLNKDLQNAINPVLDDEMIKIGDDEYRLKDKVMQIENNYDKEVFNGDIGFIRRIEKKNRLLWVDFDTKQVEYSFDEMGQLNLAYACTIHKSQGSEYPAVVIPVHPQHFIMLQKKLLYTAVTRGKQLVVLVGTKRALEMAVSSTKQTQRLSALRERLTGEVPDPPPLGANHLP